MTDTDLVETVPDQRAPGDEKEELGSKGGPADALKAMVAFFTIIHLNVGVKEVDAMERNFWLAPVLGLLVGLVASAVCFVFGYLGTGTALAAALAIATPYVFSKFLHFDGLVDFGDGMIVSSGKREDHVRALKDSLIGAGGLGVALIAVLVTFCAYMAVFDAAAAGGRLGDGRLARAVAFAVVVIATEILVKNAQVAAAAFGEPGSGMAARQVGETDMVSLIRSTVVAFVLVTVVSFAGYKVFDSGTVLMAPGAAVASFAAAVLLSVAVGWLMARTANRTFGFVNGDILGATNEISRAVILLTAALILYLPW